MLDALVHRGPDGRQVVSVDAATFGHCALPFSGDTPTAQPLLTASGQTMLVFNGEIYNIKELQGRLSERGVRYHSDSDTEVLGELLERYGVECLKWVRGMFAFASFHCLTHTLTLARDPFGKKPLYFTLLRQRGGHRLRLAFASELSALARHPEVDSQPDPSALVQYLVLRAYPAPTTAIRGVEKVPAGGVVQLAPGGPAHRIAASAPRVDGLDADRSPDAVDAGLERLLRQAVCRRLHSTGDRLGVLLSGGLDSSILAALAQQESDRPVPTFTVGFTNADFDESAHARAVAGHLGTEHHERVLSPADLAEVVTNDVTRLDEPLADESVIPMLALADLAGSRLRAVLTGDGADELLLGYRFFEAQRVMDLLGPAATRCALGTANMIAHQLPARTTNLPIRTVLTQLARSAGLPPEHRFALATAPFSPHGALRLLTADLRAEVSETAEAAEPAVQVLTGIDRFVSESGAADASDLRRSQLAVLGHFLRDVVLTKVDRAAMLHGLEPRSPFLDADVAEYCLALPPRVSMSRLTGKAPLRRLAGRWLPEQVARRTKQGFRVPLAALLRQELRPLLTDALSPAQLRASGVFDQQQVRTLLAEHFDGRREHSRALWALLCFQLWQANVTAATPRQHPRDAA